MRVIVWAVVLAGFLMAGAASGPSCDEWRPVLSAALPDPEVYHEDGYWYIYGTGWPCYVGEQLSPGKMKRVDQHLDFGKLGGPYEVWRFTVYKHTDATYHAYVTVHYGHYRTGLAHFIPAEGQVWRPGAPVSRWVLASEIICGPDPHAPSGGYDVEAVRDGDGTLYLLYVGGVAGRQGGKIMAQRMLNPYEVDRSFTPRPILSPEGYRSEDRNPGYIQLVEGPRIAKVGPKYVLTYSVGDFRDYPGVANNYKIGVAYSDVLIPPQGEEYEKPLTVDPDNLWGNMHWEGVREQAEICYLMQSQRSGWPNDCAEWVRGPGHGSILTIDGRHWLFFHGYPGDKNEAKLGRARWDWMLPLVIDIDEDRPMAEWLRVVLPGEDGPEAVLRPAPKAVPAAPNIAPQAQASASHCWDLHTASALNDDMGFIWSAWDHRGTEEWVQLDFDASRKVVGIEVYWYDDRHWGGACRPPASWKLLALQGGQWQPVTGVETYPTQIDRFNSVGFEPVTTEALRIRMQLQAEMTAGIYEWRVIAGGQEPRAAAP